MKQFDCVVVGAGIVGLSTAMALLNRFPGQRVMVLEKENGVGHHQTGHNSGVIHSGIYYPPGSAKAEFARAGNRSMVAFCREHGVDHEICGKLIVATESHELPLLENLFRRGVANGLALRKVGCDELRDREPHVAGLAAIDVPSAGIVNFQRVAEAMAKCVAERGGEIHFDTRVDRIHEGADTVTLETNAGTYESRMMINCAGLHCDRVADLAGVRLNVRIVPFRGEYYELRVEKRYLVRNLVYPVPNPAFPFLGVHFTRMIDGSVHAGPNAVVSLKREGYRKTDFALSDAIDVLGYGGFWRLAGKHAREGAAEVFRSISKKAFVRSLRRLIPEIDQQDVIPAHAGVRAQALRPDGALVDDFLILQGRRSIHVVNAPSPAATASLEIGAAVANRVAEFLVPEPA